MKSPAHVLDARKRCTRCGLSASHGRTCPPGFWMTPEELRQWDAASPRRREELEANAIGRRAKT